MTRTERPWRNALSQSCVRQRMTTSNGLFLVRNGDDLCFCRWSDVEWADDDDWLDGLDLPWSAERRSELESGDVEPSEAELLEWRRAACQHRADECQGSIGWVVPVDAGEAVRGWALFEVDLEHDEPDDEPHLLGVFETSDQAIDHIKSLGALARTGPGRLDYTHFTRT